MTAKLLSYSPLMFGDSLAKKTTTNTTLLRLKNTPFSSASEMKVEEERLLKEEWENVERARVRRLLLKKDENQDVIAPFIKGFQAKFIGDANENLVRVHLTKDDAVQIDIDDELKSADKSGVVESLVKSLTESFMSGYLSAIGLKDDSLFQAARKQARHTKG